MKKFLIAILAFLYFNTNVDAPVPEHFRMAERSGNVHRTVPKKGTDIVQKTGKGNSKQNNHLQND